MATEAEQLAAPVPGAWIERKTFGFGLHTRTTPAGPAAEIRRQIDELMAREAPDWRRRPGHDMTEYSYRTEGKDAAVARLREEFSPTAVLFAGDDVTDEDAIRSLGPSDLGIRIGPGETSAAVRVADIEELAQLLTDLAEARVRHGGDRGRE